MSGVAPSLADIEALARRAFDNLPEPFRRNAGDVVFHVEDFADAETLDALEIDDPFELTGLYRGVDRLHRSVTDPEPHTPRVFLYRRPILDEWAERGDVTLAALVEHVVVHEIGHHFGLSDADIEAIEARD
ncbi:MAG TPA: metallopeptidase family protein [Caulobacteraceae bacterium]|nr:metallopeptidase family protein [Caulobacteraceae bacterium]